jgi:hypothetical protein
MQVWIDALDSKSSSLYGECEFDSLLQIIRGEGIQNCVLKDEFFKMCKTGHFHFAKNRTFLLCFNSLFFAVDIESYSHYYSKAPKQQKDILIRRVCFRINSVKEGYNGRSSQRERKT